MSLVFSLLPACGLTDLQRSDAVEVPVYPVTHQARGQGAPLRQRILVPPFLDEKTTRSDKVAEVARRTLIQNLYSSQSFVIVNNSDMPHDLGKYINERREYNLEQIAAVAKNMGISAIIEGKILEVKAQRIGDEIGIIRKIKARTDVTVRIRVVAARNGREILSTSRSASVEAYTTRVAEYTYSDRFLEDDPNLVLAAAKKAFNGAAVLIMKAIDKLDWEGRVALVSGERIFVNAGRLSGVQIGDIMKVTETGDEVFDPENGRYIGQAPGRMKGTIEVVSYFGQDGAIAIVHSGSGFKENDRVELY
ncbi:MAG: hypothetical protein H6626_03720 [Pseudobdellovibrionaceae bacterium]|nr:MAG: hypothetical protein H6626_03720 [Pseudobdellovibrionaceae bacterium]